MSRRRLDKLEGALGPKEAVLRWMAEAHAFGSLPAYVASLIDQPETAQPFVALPAQVEKAVWEAMRGQRTGFITEVTREAVGDTVFLLRLVVGLNVHVEEVLRVERLRHASLYWWSRALEAEEKRDKGERPEWRRSVATLRGVLSGTERARASAEARYLDGHDCLFPELAAGSQGLCATAELLGGDAGLDLPPPCHNGNPDHVAAPRGSRTWTQGGVSTKEAGRIPWELAERFRMSIEDACAMDRTCCPSSVSRMRHPSVVESTSPLRRHETWPR